MAVARRRQWTGIGLALLVGVGGLAASSVTAVAVDRLEQRHAEQLMNRYADEASRAVSDQANRYQDTLSDLAASVGAQSDFTAQDFTGITARLSRQRLPGASGVTFAVPAATAQVAEVQAYWRTHGAAGLRLMPAAGESEHLFVVFSHSFNGTTVATGRDMTTAAEPTEALRMSRINGQVTASRTYVFLKDQLLPASQRQMSFLLAAPIVGGAGTPDAGRFRGWVVMGMRGGDFIGDALPAATGLPVRVALIDMSSGWPVVAAGVAAASSSQLNPLDRNRNLRVGERQWQLRVYPTAALLSGGDRRQAVVTLGGGVLITLLLTALVAVLTGARNRAMERVDQAIAALRADIEKRKTIEARLREREGQLQQLAFHDPLTGLANRTLFHERVEHALATHLRSEQTLAVLFIDLDGFKEINDDLGHGGGDAALAEVAVRLVGCVRGSDTVARLGGDEFAILTEQISSNADYTRTVAERVIRALRVPFLIDGHPVGLTGSVGVAMRGSAHGSAHDILRTADEAMYAAKALGKDRYVLTTDDVVSTV